MIKTEMMKKYEAETSKQSTRFVTDDIHSAGIEVWHYEYIQWLEAQLTWRPVSEKLPSVEKDGNAVIARLKDLDEGLVQFDVVSTLWFIDNYESWYTHWLPIPPAPEEICSSTH